MKVLAVMTSLVLLLNISCVSALAASANEDIVLQMQGGQFKVYRDVRTVPQRASSASQKAASASRSVSRQVKSASQRAAQPAKKAKSVSKQASSRARAASRQVKSVSRKAAEPARKVSRAAASPKRQAESIGRNAEELYSDVMKSKSLMEQTVPEPIPVSEEETWAHVETVQYVPETEPLQKEPEAKKKIVKFIPVILAAIGAVAGTVLLVKKKTDDRRDEGEYKSFQ